MVSFHLCVCILVQDEKKYLFCTTFLPFVKRFFITQQSINTWFYLKIILSVYNFVSVWAHLISLPLPYLLLYPPCCLCSSFFSWPPLPAPRKGGMQAIGWMCYHSNKLTHWQDCSIFWATGGQQQMQLMVCDSSLHISDTERTGATPILQKEVQHPQTWGGWWWRMETVIRVVCDVCSDQCCSVCFCNSPLQHMYWLKHMIRLTYFFSYVLMKEQDPFSSLFVSLLLVGDLIILYLQCFEATLL